MFCFASLDGARERSRSHPSPASRDGRRAKIPSPQPASFLPACWKPPADFSGGGTSNWAEGGVSILSKWNIFLIYIILFVCFFRYVTLSVLFQKIFFYFKISRDLTGSVCCPLICIFNLFCIVSF